MKKFIFGLVALTSVSAFAECVQINSIKGSVCADMRDQDNGVTIVKISPDIQKSKAIAKELCASFGDGFSDYNIEITTKKSCHYYATKGFFAGGMVDACNDFGGLTRGTVISKIKCIKK